MAKGRYEFPFKDPTIQQLVKAAYPGAKSRRTVGVDARESYHVHDFWDGGSKTECVFVRLEDLAVKHSSEMPDEARQVMANPFNLPIGDTVLPPGYAVVEHVIFCGKDLGYRIILNPANLAKLLKGNSQ